MTTAAGGVTELSGVTPDIVTLAKAMGGGVPCGAIGGTAEVMAFVADGRYEQVETFNGNPLTMASARAMLAEVTTPEAYTRCRPHASIWRVRAAVHRRWHRRAAASNRSGTRPHPAE